MRLEEAGNKSEFFETLKDMLLKRNSEGLFCIDEPPAYQCPRIDEVINNASNAISKCKDVRKNIYNDSDISEGEIEEISDNLSDVDSTMEDIRSAIEEVREWGNSWKELAKDLVFDKLRYDKEFMQCMFSICLEPPEEEGGNDE